MNNWTVPSGALQNYLVTVWLTDYRAFLLAN